MRSREREKDKSDLLEAVEHDVVAPVVAAAPNLALLLASPDLALKPPPLNPPLKAAIAATVAALIVEHYTGYEQWDIQ
ncbi:hypothetical protein QYF36_010498 [Acer negundo]|nr:hypothetical protein QYF36_010498 [Acer negundo]